MCASVHVRMFDWSFSSERPSARVRWFMRLFVCATACCFACIAACLFVCLLACLRSCVVKWLHGCMVAWLHGCIVAWMCDGSPAPYNSDSAYKRVCVYACTHMAMRMYTSRCACMHACMSACPPIRLSAYVLVFQFATKHTCMHARSLCEQPHISCAQHRLCAYDTRTRLCARKQTYILARTHPDVRTCGWVCHRRAPDSRTCALLSVSDACSPAWPMRTGAISRVGVYARSMPAGSA